MSENIYVYIAAPYTKGDQAENVRTAIEAANHLACMGLKVFCPHLTHFWHMLYPHSFEFWINHDFAWLDRCDCVLRLPGESKGADMEVARAAELRIPCFHDMAEVAYFASQRRKEVLK